MGQLCNTPLSTSPLLPTKVGIQSPSNNVRALLALYALDPVLQRGEWVILRNHPQQKTAPLYGSAGILWPQKLLDPASNPDDKDFCRGSCGVSVKIYRHTKTADPC